MEAGCRFQDAMPDLTMGAELLPTRHGLGHGEVREVLIPIPHGHIRAARHASIGGCPHRYA